MNVRLVEARDRDLLLTSFKPMFGDWDYLPMVVDDWLKRSDTRFTWVVEDGPMLAAMAQAHETEPGEWYLNGLRSNPEASSQQVGAAILGLMRRMERRLRQAGAHSVRDGTLPSFVESRRLARILGFREQFRLGHSWHPCPSAAGGSTGPECRVARDTDAVFERLSRGAVLTRACGRFFTWWDTRRFTLERARRARSSGRLLQCSENGEPEGWAFFWHVQWQGLLVLSVMEGSDLALGALFRAGISAAHRLGCKGIGVVHPSLSEMHRRERLFGLQPGGCHTIQFVKELLPAAEW
ncbi:MAG: hypothetical protein JSU73_05050 [candidate division WOR-3 bacterium]|nr:MAG: hypothetical protein JSU73_05050 [candidate division WOR-3 bacterium]